MYIYIYIYIYRYRYVHVYKTQTLNPSPPRQHVKESSVCRDFLHSPDRLHNPSQSNTVRP